MFTGILVSVHYFINNYYHHIIYTTSRMTTVSRYGRIQLSREERSRNDAPDYAFMHIHDRSDADADRCFGMLTWNAIRYHRKRIGSCYGQLI